MQMSAESRAIMDEMDRLEKVINDNLWSMRDYLIKNGIVYETIRDQSYETQRAVIIQHTPWLKELSNHIHKLNLDWNINEGLY